MDLSKIMFTAFFRIFIQPYLFLLGLLKFFVDLKKTRIAHNREIMFAILAGFAKPLDPKKIEEYRKRFTIAVKTVKTDD